MGRLFKENTEISNRVYIADNIEGLKKIAHLPQVTEEIEVSDLLISYLMELEVEYIFGVPGGAIEPLYNAMARSERRHGLKSVVARHETGAAFMAAGYASNSGKIGVCCATTGPGATNLITGVASAYEENVPLLVITPQSVINNFGRKTFQDSSDTGVNIVGMFQYCTHYNSLVSHPDQFEEKLVAALMAAMANSGPVHLSVPLDVLKSKIARTKSGYNIKGLLEKPHIQDSRAVERLAFELETASKPVFLVGGACDEASGLILRLASQLGAKIVTTAEGKGFVSPYHPLFCGVLGFAGHDSATAALLDPDVDVVVAIGTALGEWSSNGWDSNVLMNSRLIHVDEKETNLARSPMARLHVRGRILSVFETLNQKATGFSSLESIDSLSLVPEKQEASLGLQFYREECWDPGNQVTGVKPQWLMQQLTTLFPPNTRYLADTGNSMTWAIHYLHPFDRRRLARRKCGRSKQERRTVVGGLFQTSPKFASMGWAIGCSVGAALANSDGPVVCLTGDGSMLMSGQEITVAQQLGLSVIYIILNDSSLGMVNHGQKMAGAELIGSELPDVNFADMAKAMGIKSYLVKKPQDLLGIDFATLMSSGPVLIDVRIDAQQVPPMGMRVKVLANEQ
jgi:acetolactate synthase-1/2/3 large subunit